MSHWAKIKVLSALCALLEALGKNPFSGSFRLWPEFFS